MTGSSYELVIRNGQRWKLEASPVLEDWLQHFAHILMLHEIEKGRNCPSWRFYFQESNVSLFQGRGWVTSRSRWMSSHAKTDGTDLVTEIIPFERGDPKEDIVRMMLAIQTLYLAIWPFGGIPVHAALLERDGEAIMIAAPGGTGKSTCASRVPPPWHALCDDTVLLVPVGGVYYAHPLPPWSDFLIRDMHDRRWNVEYAVPVTKIWFLEHGERDQAVPLEKGQAASRLYQSAVQVSSICLRKENNNDTYADWHMGLFHRSCDAVSHFSCGILRATLDGSFWECLS